MNWLDAVIAAPAIGIHTGGSFERATELSKRLSPIFDRSLQNGSVEMDITPLRVEARLENGFVVKGDVYSLAVNGPSNEAFTKCQKEALKLLKHAIDLAFISDFQVMRIGFVVSASVDLDDLPPGIMAWKEQLVSSFSECESANVRMRVPLRKTSLVNERCHHRLSFDRNKNSDANIYLDWQRLFLKPIRELTTLQKEVDDCLKTSNTYFNRFGLGA